MKADPAMKKSPTDLGNWVVGTRRIEDPLRQESALKAPSHSAGYSDTDSTVPRIVPDFPRAMNTREPITKRLLRTKQAALYLGMSPGKLRRLTQDGELPVIQHDEHSPWLYDLRDLDSLIEKSKRKLSAFS